MADLNVTGAAGGTTPIQLPGAAGPAETPEQHARAEAHTLAATPGLDPQLKQQLESDATTLEDLGKVSTMAVQNLLEQGHITSQQQMTDALKSWAGIQLGQQPLEGTREATLQQGLAGLQSSNTLDQTQGFTTLGSLFSADALQLPIDMSRMADKIPLDISQLPLGMQKAFEGAGGQLPDITKSLDKVTPDKTIKPTKADADASRAKQVADIKARQAELQAAQDQVIDRMASAAVAYARQFPEDQQAAKLDEWLGPVHTPEQAAIAQAALQKFTQKIS